MVRRVMIASVVKFTELISDSCVQYSEIHSAREHNSLKQSYGKKKHNLFTPFALVSEKYNMIFFYLIWFFFLNQNRFKSNGFGSI
jgi:hypothetical protein